MNYFAPYAQTQLVIFDWDGTLFDSTGVIAYSLQEACGALQFHIPSLIEAQQVIGLGFNEAIERLVGHLDAAQTQVFMTAYRRSYLDAENLVTLFTGITPLLDKLVQNNKICAIATGKSRAGLDRVLAHNPELNKYFVSSRTADETQSKPHPQMLHELLDELNVSADKAVMIGDTTFDIEMAHEASMPSIAVTYGAHDYETLESARPHHIVHQVSELMGLMGVNA